MASPLYILNETCSASLTLHSLSAFRIKIPQTGALQYFSYQLNLVWFVRTAGFGQQLSLTEAKMVNHFIEWETISTSPTLQVYIKHLRRILAQKNKYVI